MPLFEYRCQACRKCFELLILLGRETKEVCSFCGSKKVNRQVSSFSVTRGSSKDFGSFSGDTVSGEDDGSGDDMGSDDPRSCAFDDSSPEPQD